MLIKLSPEYLDWYLHNLKVAKNGYMEKWFFFRRWSRNGNMEKWLFLVLLYTKFLRLNAKSCALCSLRLLRNKKKPEYVILEVIRDIFGNFIYLRNMSDQLQRRLKFYNHARRKMTEITYLLERTIHKCNCADWEFFALNFPYSPIMLKRVLFKD